MSRPGSRIFGADRCLFESNFPVDKGARSYPVLFNAFKRLASGASTSKRLIFSPAPRRGSTGSVHPILTEE